MSVFRYTPLGRLRRLQGAVIGVPILSAAALGVGGRRFGDAYIDPRYLGPLGSLVPPLLIATIAVAWFIRARVSPEAPRTRRVLLIFAAYSLALVAASLSVAYSMAGASDAWGVVGYLLGIVVIGVVPLGKYAPDIAEG